MEKTNKNALLFFIFISGLATWESYRVYFGLIPSFTRFTSTPLFYECTMLAWFALSIAQLFLISYQKDEVHKRLTKVSHILAPFLLFSFFSISKDNFTNSLSTLSNKQNLALLKISMLSFLGFAALYILSIITEKKIAYHIRYTIASLLVLFTLFISKALVVYANMAFQQAFTYSMYITEIITIVLFVYDMLESKPLRPYLIALSILFAIDIILLFGISSW